MDDEFKVKLPTPMTTSILQAYLETMSKSYHILDAPVMINGEEIVNATIIDGRVVLTTGLEFDRG